MADDKSSAKTEVIPPVEVALPSGVKPSDITPNPEDIQPAWKGSLSSKVPIVAPDGHVVLSQEDIDNYH